MKEGFRSLRRACSLGRYKHYRRLGRQCLCAILKNHHQCKVRAKRVLTEANNYASIVILSLRQFIIPNTKEMMDAHLSAADTLILPLMMIFIVHWQERPRTISSSPLSMLLLTCSASSGNISSQSVVALRVGRCAISSCLRPFGVTTQRRLVKLCVHTCNRCAPVWKQRSHRKINSNSLGGSVWLILGILAWVRWGVA